jgi:hypothetical protein
MKKVTPTSNYGIEKLLFVYTLRTLLEMMLYIAPASYGGLKTSRRR